MDSVADALGDLSLKDLRAVISESGLSSDGCIDKDGLRARAKEALQRLMQPGAHIGPTSKPLIEGLLAEERAFAQFAAEDAADMAHGVAAEASKAAGQAGGSRKAASRAADDLRTKEAALLIEALRAQDVVRFDALLHSLGPNCRSADGTTPLHVAASEGFREMAEELLAAGADPSIVDDAGQTALQSAMACNHMGIAELITDFQHTQEQRQDSAVAAAAEAAEAQRALKQVVELAAELVGKEVRVIGLKARPECNGKIGNVLSSTEKGRCMVAVHVGDKVEHLAIRPINLEEE